MYSLLIVGVMMLVLGLVFTKMPIFKIEIGPILLVAGGVACLVGLMLKG